MYTKGEESSQHIGLGYLVYLVAFFSFIRLSNFVPHRFSDFDPFRHLAVGDVIFDPPVVKLIIKRSKSIQTRDRVVCLPLPSLGLSPLCPVAALKTLLKIVPAGKNGPLFQIKCNSNFSDPLFTWPAV